MISNGVEFYARYPKCMGSFLGLNGDLASDSAVVQLYNNACTNSLPRQNLWLKEYGGSYAVYSLSHHSD